MSIDKLLKEGFDPPPKASSRRVISETDTKRLSISVRGRLTLPQVLFENKEIKGSKYFTTLFNSKTSVLAIVALQEPSPEYDCRKFSFFRTNGKPNSTAYAEIGYMIRKVFNIDKSTELPSSSVPFEIEGNAILIDLSKYKDYTGK